MVKHSRKGSRSANRKGKRSTHRKHRRFTHRKHRRFQQRGGDGYGYQGAAFAPVGSMAPVESRVGFSHCGFPTRPGSLVGGARHKGSRSARRSRRQRGGVCSGGCTPGIQYGGGGGTGGYAINVSSNDIGKMYASVDARPCPGPERPGAQAGGANMMDTRVVSSFPAGYGFAPDSAVEVGHGTAHYLNPISYGRQCMGGGRRKAHRRTHRR